MGKRRGTAKTGDKSFYKNKKLQESGILSTTARLNDDDDDPMYDKVDRFHNDRDANFLALDQDNDAHDDEEVDLGGRQDAIMDLGLGDESDDSSTSASSSGSDDDGQAGAGNLPDSAALGSTSDSSEDDEDEDDDGIDVSELALDDPRRWGKRKSLYYHGDTADLEIGQDEEDAYLEEEAAKEVQAARLKEMGEDDFVLSDDDEPQDSDSSANNRTTDVDVAMTARRDLGGLSAKEKRNLIKRRHPELLPILGYFSDIVQDFQTRTDIATAALFDGEEGAAEAVNASQAGQKYLLTKAMLQSSAALNVAMYLLLKADANSSSEADQASAAALQAHPVLARLEQMNGLLQKLEDNVESKNEDISKQLDKLAKAATLLSSGGIEGENEGDDSQSLSDEAADSDSIDSVNKKRENCNASQIDSCESDSDSSERSQGAVPPHRKRPERSVQNEARFALRTNEISEVSKTKGRVRSRAHDSLQGDFGDGDGENYGLKSFSSTINAIEQRSKTSSRKAAKKADMADQLDDIEENEYGRFDLDAMEEDDRNFGGTDFDGVGAAGDDDNDRGYDNAAGDDGDFYSKVAKKSATKKKQKKAKYQVQPRYPGMDREVTGERAVGKMIMKNRGLVAHKSKLNRNPRVKKREQYRKALIRRKGSVREVRTGETHKYGGEQSGIRSGISRSRHLA